MELDDRGGNCWLAPFRTSGKETEDLHRIIGFAQSEKRRGGGGLLRPVWNGGWAITKPLLAAYLTKKIAEKAKFQDANSIADAIRWAAAFLRGIKIE